MYDWTMAKVFRMQAIYAFQSPPSNEAVTTHDWEWIGTGDPPSNAYETVEAKFDAFYTATLASRANGTYLQGYRWSEWKEDFSGLEPSFRYATRNTNIGSTDTGVGGYPVGAQLSIAVTEETDFRRRWGRFYLPFPSKGAGNERISDSTCNTIGAAAVTLLSTVEAEWRHVTVSSKTPRLLETRFVRVDNVWDVIRSRRVRASSHRYRGAVS